MAKHAQKTQTPLAMYLLEEYHSDSNVDVYHRCIAWQLLLAKHGYYPQSLADCEHIKALSPQEGAHYRSIRNTDIIALCGPSRNLAPAILAARRGKRSEQSQHTVRVRIPAGQYADLRRQARAHGHTPGDYLLLCATHAPIGPDLSVITGYHRDVSRYLTLLRNCIIQDSIPATHIHQIHEDCCQLNIGLQRVIALLTDITSQ